MKKTIFLSLALIVLTFAAAQETLACSCIVTDTPEKQQVLDAYQGSTAVFSGEVIEVVKTSDNTNTVKFKLIDSWKWAFGDIVTVTTATDSAMCGFEFVTGKKYLVYANQNAENMSVNNCSRTRTFEAKSADVKYLKKYKQKKAAKKA